MRLKIFFALLLLGATAVAARATPMTYDVNFSATGATNASASFTLKFDPTLYYLNSSTDFKVNSFVPTSLGNIPAGFSYDPNLFGGVLTIGGLLNTSFVVLPFTNDYLLAVTNFQTLPTFAVFARTTSGSFLPLVDVNGSVRVSSTAVTPEPSSLLMLGTGAVGILGAFRRRFA